MIPVNFNDFEDRKKEDKIKQYILGIIKSKELKVARLFNKIIKSEKQCFHLDSYEKLETIVDEQREMILTEVVKYLSDKESRIDPAKLTQVKEKLMIDNRLIKGNKNKYKVFLDLLWLIGGILFGVALRGAIGSSTISWVTYIISLSALITLGIVIVLRVKNEK